MRNGSCPPSAASPHTSGRDGICSARPNGEPRWPTASRSGVGHRARRCRLNVNDPTVFRRDCFKPNCATTLFNQRDSAVGRPTARRSRRSPAGRPWPCSVMACVRRDRPETPRTTADNPIPRPWEQGTCGTSSSYANCPIIFVDIRSYPRTAPSCRMHARTQRPFLRLRLRARGVWFVGWSKTVGGAALWLAGCGCGAGYVGGVRDWETWEGDKCGHGDVVGGGR